MDWGSLAGFSFQRFSLRLFSPALTVPARRISTSNMAGTYQVKEAQRQLPKLLREAEAGGIATIWRRNKPVAHVIGAERMAAIAETMEILANPAAMKAVRSAEAGRGRNYPAADLPE
jgi:antitoxin YefM